MATLSDVLSNPTNGMTGREIRNLQRTVGLRDADGAVDGIWGPKCQEAYEKYKLGNKVVQEDYASMDELVPDVRSEGNVMSDWFNEYGGEVMSNVGTSVLTGLLTNTHDTAPRFQQVGSSGSGGANTLSMILGNQKLDTRSPAGLRNSTGYRRRSY